MGNFIKLTLLLGAMKVIQSLPLISNLNEIIDLSVLGNSIHGTPDEQVGQIVSEWKPDSGTNPEELGSYFEGDLLIPIESRNGLVKKSSFWPNGVVPFLFDASVPESDRTVVLQCIDEYHTKTCIKFVERTTEVDYVLIKNTPTGCWSSAGRIGGKQELNLQTGGCTSRIGTPCHELMHALGFLHEHSRTDRDRYVRIVRQNIKPETYSNFQKAMIFTTTTYNVPYNIESIMHYGPTAFSKNGKKTIEVLKGSDESMGQRDGFADSDLLKINRRYKCSAFLSSEMTTGNETTTQLNFGEMVSGFLTGVGDFFNGFGGKMKKNN